ncbi:MAG: ATP-binding protein [Leptolyngbyaceae cyanobacterium]
MQSPMQPDPIKDSIQQEIYTIKKDHIHCAIESLNSLKTGGPAIRVLLVDDQLVVAETIHQLLMPESDIQFHHCREAQKAIQTAIAVKPTVILQDLVMPGADGLVLVEFFRKNPATHDVPIIVLSAKEEPSVKAESFAHGANDYLVKTPDPVELVARIRYHSAAYINLLKRYEAEQTLEEQVAKRTATLKATFEALQQTQSKLIQDEKMKSLGQLVAGIAHEMNNPVNFIYGNIEPAQNYAQDLLDVIHLYREAYPEPSVQIQTKLEELDIDFVTADFLKLLSSLRVGTVRIRDIVRSLRNFSRLDEADRKCVDVHLGIESTLLILGSKLKQIQIVKDFNADTSIECFPSQLNQVFLNIIVNAADALLEIHQKDLKAGVQIDPAPEIRIYTATTLDNHIEVAITDNGPGMPQQVRDRMFDPFFTTKPSGKGTGLGLAISHQIVVEKHQGTIDCISTFGKGTTFTLRLPIKSPRL